MKMMETKLINQKINKLKNTKLPPNLPNPSLVTNLVTKFPIPHHPY